MARSFSGDVGAFLPTTSIFDPGLVRSLNVNSEEFKEVLVQLMQSVNNIALVTNIKDTGYYYTGTQFVNGQVYFPNPALNSTTAQAPIGRQVTRVVINFGALPNAGAKTAAHGISINSAVTFTRIYATASQPSTRFIPIPFASPTLNENIKIEVDATHVTITTAIDYSAFTVCYVVLEYLTS